MKLVPPSNKPTRRDALKTAAGAAAVFQIVPCNVLGGPKHVAPSDKINLGLGGGGGRGLKNVAELLKYDDAQITAIADPAEMWDLSGFYYKGVAGRAPARSVIEKHYEKKGAGRRCAEYEDFRVMLEQEKSLDAVLVATPDHLHAAVSLAAMRDGLHVYCEKPLTHNIAEARLVADVARESGVATQMGNQGHSTEGIRQTCETIWAGAIGSVREVHSWVPTSRWNPELSGKPAGSQPVPKGLNWDLWQGPRRSRPFHSAYAPVAWRDFRTFGCGAIGDFGCHDLDAACWALDLKTPTSVEMRPAGYTDAEIVPHGEIGYFQFAARGSQPPVRITWYSGGLRPQHPDGLPPEVELPRRGVLFVGDKGLILCGGAGGAPRLFPEQRRQEFVAPKPTIARSKGHHRDWLDAIKGGDAASSNFEYGAHLTEITLLALVALRTGKKILWEPNNLKATGVPEADPIIHGEYRSGWALS